MLQFLLVSTSLLSTSAAPVVGSENAFVLAGLTRLEPEDRDDLLRLSNIEVYLTKVGPARIDARIINPNAFPVYHIIAECNFGNRRGQIIGAHAVTIIDAIQAKAIRNIKQFAVLGWPNEAWTASCTSQRARRLAE